MDQCTDKKIGNLLHAFELGILGDKDQLDFETHLLACDYCFQRANKLLPAVSLLKKDSEIGDIVQEVASSGTEEQKASQTVISRLFSSSLVRYAVAATLLFSVGVPLVKYSLQEDSQHQTILLSPVRGSEQAIVDLEMTGTVEIAFVIPGANKETACRVAIYSENGDTLFFQNNCDAFNDNGKKVIELETSQFKRGIYTLSASNCVPADDSNRIYYILAR